MSDIELINQIDAYLRGELSAQEHADFESLRSQNPELDHRVVEHQNFLNQLSGYGKQRQLRAHMDSIHEQIDIEGLKQSMLPVSFRIHTMWRKYRANMAIAASVAVFAVLSTLLSTGYFNKTVSSNFSALRRELNSIKRSQNELKKDMILPSKGPVNPGHFGGTGFALTANGYVVTNYHVVKDADSVYVQNTAGESYKVKQIYVDPAYDIAVLHITDPNFKAFPALPYTFKKSASDLGEDVYTIGFPRDERVFNKGYLSSLTGFAGDTVSYQVDISVNPGNSGGPLLDNKGNVIGIINGKQTQAEGAAFAIKSNFLLRSLASIPQDSLEDKLVLNKKNSLAGLSRTDQIKKLKDYVFMVKVY